MSNRINRTLSANLNRLNLGTRSLALVNDANNDKATLRSRHDVHPVYPVVPVRVGFTPVTKKETPTMKPMTSIEMTLISISIRGSLGIMSGLELGTWEPGSTSWKSWTSLDSLQDVSGHATQDCLVVADAPPSLPQVVPVAVDRQRRRSQGQAYGTGKFSVLEGRGTSRLAAATLETSRVRATRSRTATSLRPSSGPARPGARDRILTSAAASS